MQEIERNSKIPIFKQIYKILYDEITGGVYSYSDKLPSENELKERFGVERNTVRHALKFLADERLIIKVPGYGNKIANPSDITDVETNENRNILFITQQNYLQDDNSEHFHLKLIDGLDKIFSPINYNLIFKSSARDFNLPNIARFTDPAAIIFDSYNKKELYETAKNLNIPSISVNHYTPELTSVVSNNFDGSYRVMKMLGESGHERIAFITGKENYQTTIERMSGIQSYYIKNNISYDNKYFIPGQWTFASGFEAGEMILSMKSDERPTAVFALNDDMAFGCLSYFEKQGVSVPDDISLVGFDQSDRYADIFRPITTVDVNIEAIVKYTHWYLMGIIHDTAPSVCAKIQIDTAIRDNGTVKNIK